MKGKTTLFLLVLAVLLGGFIWFFERGTDSTDERKDYARRVLRMRPDKVDTLRLESTNLTIKCVRENDGWWIQDPIRARADEGAVDRILYGLEGVQRREVITVADREERGSTLADYGLDQPRMKISFKDDTGRRTLLIGRTAPLGGSVYVREDLSEDIVAAPRGLLDLVPETLADLRDRTLIAESATHIQRLGIQRVDGYLQIARREGGSWMIQQPIVARADGVKVLRLLSDLLNLSVEEFIADGAGDAAAYGLAEPVIQVTFWGDGEERGRTLLLGPPLESRPDLIYAKWEGEDSVYAIAQTATDLLDLKINDVRSRRLLPLRGDEVQAVRIEEGERSIELEKAENETWTMIRPRQERADDMRVKSLLGEWGSIMIEAFVDDQGTNLAALGFVPPARILTFSRKRLGESVDDGEAESAVQDVAKVTVSSAQREKGRILVKLDSEQSFYEVSAGALQGVSVEPLFFKNRRVLSVEPENIRRIKLVKGKTEQTLERENSSAAFKPIPDGAGEVVADRVDDLLEMLRGLDVDSFVEENPEKLGRFGLDAPRATLQLGLAPEAGIGKAVLLGDKAAAGTYGMIRGQDVVFVIDTTVSQRLMRDLYVSPSRPDEAPVDDGTVKADEL